MAPAREDARPAQPLGDLVAQVVEHIKARPDHPELPTGFPALDDVIWGLHRTEVTVIAARPGEGKTTAALQMAGHLAQLGKRVLFISLEMSAHQIVERWLIQLTQVEAWSLRTGRQCQPFLDKLAALGGFFKEIPLRCLDDLGVTLNEVTDILHQTAMQAAPPDVLIVDFIQLIEADEEMLSDMEAIKRYLRGLKRLAKAHNMAVLVCSQINREGGKASAKAPPKLIHLKGSGAIEELADCVLMLWWQELGTEEDPQGTKYWICVEKQRYGAPGNRVQVNFDAAHLTFRSAEPSVAPWTPPKAEAGTDETE